MTQLEGVLGTQETAELMPKYAAYKISAKGEQMVERSIFLYLCVFLDPDLEGFLKQAKREEIFKIEIQHIAKFEAKKGGTYRYLCWEWEVENGGCKLVL